MFVGCTAFRGSAFGQARDLTADACMPRSVLLEVRHPSVSLWLRLTSRKQCLSLQNTCWCIPDFHRLSKKSCWHLLIQVMPLLDAAALCHPAIQQQQPIFAASKTQPPPSFLMPMSRLFECDATVDFQLGHWLAACCHASKLAHGMDGQLVSPGWTARQ